MERPFCIIEPSSKFDNNNTIPKLIIDEKPEPIFDEVFYSNNPNHSKWISENNNIKYFLDKFLNQYDFDDMTYHKDKKYYIEERPTNFFDIFDLGNSTNKNVTENNLYQIKYIEYNNLETSCKIYEDFDTIIYIVIIVVPICYLFLIVYLIFVYCRYRRIYSQYSRLRDEKEGENHISYNEKVNNRIELGNISHLDK